MDLNFKVDIEWKVFSYFPKFAFKQTIVDALREL